GAGGGGGGMAGAGGNGPVLRAVNAWPASTGDALWSNLTQLGDAAAVIALSAPLVARRPRFLWSGVLAAAISTLAIQPLKHLLSVARPVRVLGSEAVHVIGPRLSSNSFPSGHATTAFTAAALVLASARGGWPRAAVLAAAALVALSRLAVGAHWPLDALGGAALGWLGGCAGVHLALRWPAGATPLGRRLLALLPLAAAVLLLVPDK